MNVFGLQIHPAADLLPRLADPELADLADDIAANGQRDPIVVWIDGDGKRWLLDGRNRSAACKIAAIEPSVVEATIEQIPDPMRFVVSKNLNRRHMAKGQIAVALALLDPIGKPGRPTEEKPRSECGVSARLLSEARRALRENRPLALDVLAGREPVGRLYHETPDPVARAEQPQQRPITDEHRRVAREVRKSHRTGTARKPKPVHPAPPDERARLGTRDTDDADLKKAIAAFGMLASLASSCDAFALVRKHGNPSGWRYFGKARQFIRDLEDSV